MRPKPETPRAAACAALLIFLALLPAGPAPAAEEPVWRPARLFGADVRSLAFAPHDPDLAVAGTAGGQLSVSRDGGVSWESPTRGIPFPGWVLTALAFDVEHPQRLWVGARGVFGGGMVAFTDDLGASWEIRRVGIEAVQVYSLAVVPGHPDWLYAGTRDGVYGTTDGGASWHRLTGAHPALAKVTSLAVAPGDPVSVLAGTWRRAYRSDDAGVTWYGVFEGMVEDTEVFRMSPVPGSAGELWASTCGWIYHSVDFGRRWSRVKAWDFPLRRTPSIEVLSQQRLLAGTVGGLFASEDGGTSWERRGPAGLPVLEIAVHPDRPQVVLLGTEGPGIYRSADGGLTFAPASVGLTNLRIAALARSGEELLVAVRDAASASGLYRSRDGGRSFERQDVELPPLLDLAVAGDRELAATEGGLFERRAGEWRGVAELGKRRVELLVAHGSDVVAATASEMWRLEDGRFRAMPWGHGPPRSLVLDGGSLWVAEAQRLHRLTPTANHTFRTPDTGGRITRLGDAVVWTGRGSLWRFEGESWRQLAEAGPAYDTGDSQHPLALFGGDAVRLLDATGAVTTVLPALPRGLQVRDVRLLGDRLLVGTNGQGLWELSPGIAAAAP